MLDMSNHERIVHLHIEKLPEDIYLATSDDVQGLVARDELLLKRLKLLGM